MTARRVIDDERRAVVALELLVERTVDGFVRTELDERLIAAGLAQESNAAVRSGLSIRALRREFGNDVVVLNRRTGRYRLSTTRDEALAWLVTLLGQIERRLANFGEYLDAALVKWTGEATAKRSIEMLRDSLSFAEKNANYAARLLVDDLVPA